MYYGALRARCSICDVLRIVGCRLTPNDWDLIALIFTTRHTHRDRTPYTVEVIDSPLHAERVQKSFPYFEVRSILEIDHIGSHLVSELIDGEPRPFTTLTEEEKNHAMMRAGTDKNWFRLWLKQMAEFLYLELGSVQTPLGALQKLLEAY